ncbi:hypothetical protein IME11_70 [Escherichia phage IME11]|uniref:Uncharacterized protein n=1 Tax=Escherichia phage IME11 TaxID=1239384 RepID=K4MPV5_9CAUD|nr:hypothetical protein IME11_70 [Escherichia phage IME11]AFV29119.1 hypothetical protein IME11_70 [Escherichia phage IME11]
MEIIILVTLLIMNGWQKRNGKEALCALKNSDNYIAAVVLGYFSSLLSGVTIGYTIWFVMELLVKLFKLYS